MEQKCLFTEWRKPPSTVPKPTFTYPAQKQHKGAKVASWSKSTLGHFCDIDYLYCGHRPEYFCVIAGLASASPRCSLGCILKKIKSNKTVYEFVALLPSCFGPRITILLLLIDQPGHVPTQCQRLGGNLTTLKIAHMEISPGGGGSSRPTKFATLGEVPAPLFCAADGRGPLHPYICSALLHSTAAICLKNPDSGLNQIKVSPEVKIRAQK